jgi:hypothetical protein
VDSNGVMEPTENVATIERGAIVVEGVSRHRSTLLNGNTSQYDWEDGYTCHQVRLSVLSWMYHVNKSYNTVDFALLISLNVSHMLNEEYLQNEFSLLFISFMRLCLPPQTIAECFDIASCSLQMHFRKIVPEIGFNFQQKGFFGHGAVNYPIICASAFAFFSFFF